MAGSFSNDAENKILDRVFGGVAYAPANLYAALFTVTPSDAGGGTEVSGNNYSRVTVACNQTNFPAASGGSIANGTVITFPTPSADWGTIVAFGFYDASSGGNLVVWDDFTGVTVPSGVVASIAVGQLTVALD